MAATLVRIRSISLRGGRWLRSFISLRASSNYQHQKETSITAFTSQRSVGDVPATHSVQTTDTVLMIRPTFFNYNPKTAGDNIYQGMPAHLRDLGPEEIAALAVQEADKFASALRENGVHVVEESPLEDQRDCWDAVFPNNWVSFHDGRIAVYPMMAENRRRERRWDLVRRLSEHLGAEVVDYTPWEKESKFLEGTGSLVLDRVNKIAYACLSERTDPIVVDQFCRDFGYEAVKFTATQAKEDGVLLPVYHTNVICTLGDSFALLCPSCIRDPEEKRMVVESISKSGKEMVDIEENQVYQYASNALQLRNSSGEKVLVMSTKAYNSLKHDQLATLRRHVDHIIHSPLSTIEALGGGSARCMLAEVFHSSKGKPPREL